MEKMYNQYKDVVEFRMVYINEAHAADSNWASTVAKDKGINNHKNFGERCTTAKMLMDDESLTIPCVIDGMDNKINKAYSAWPDRVFLVRSDGRLAVAAERGPWGFGPALEKVDDWLADYRETGNEPKLSDEAIAEAEKRAAEKAKKKADSTTTAAKKTDK